METYFAPPERASDDDLRTKIDIVSTDPVMSGLLHSVSGLLAVLDEHRQIIALNDSFLQMLGINEPAEALGLRPGEALQCIHAEEGPAGCGTSKFCSSCGAAIAIVSSIGQDIPIERMCAFAGTKNDKPVDMFLMVKSQPIKINDERFLLLFLQDITLQQHRAALERTFFHDINNMLSMLVQASELLREDHASEHAETIYQASNLLYREVYIQRYLSDSETGNYQPIWHAFKLEYIFKQLQAFFSNHPAASNKRIIYSNDFPEIVLKTDISALLRVLCNMIINALENSVENGVVKIWTEHGNHYLTFCVWNDQVISKDISLRIFQRNFSTTDQVGRGIGTYSMKLFGEKVLGGQVGFSSSVENGTIFRFTHPLQ